jgi:formamidopyrimidine-DNA glycosylase
MINMVRERLSRMKYTIRKKKPSIIDKEAFVWEELGLRCPHCETVMDKIEHRERRLCCKCGLIITRIGDALDCELEVV